MGCDIHMWLEYRRSGQPWRILRRVSCCACYGEGNAECYRCDGGKVDILARVVHDDGGSYLRGGVIYDHRNYHLFHALAGVRKWPGAEPELIPPRGIPEDCTAEYRELSKGEDWHSHSWLTLADVERLRIVHFREDADGSVFDPGDDFYRSVVRRYMEPIGRRLGNENVRIVFFFDN